MVEQLCDVDNGYEELAYELYKAGDSLLHDLVAVRKDRGMTQEQLADAMNVSCSVVKEIEDGETDLTSLLTDYALEVGARVEYKVEKAEDKRRWREQHYSTSEPLIGAWDGELVFLKRETQVTIRTQDIEYEGKSPSHLESISSSDACSFSAELELNLRDMSV